MIIIEAGATHTKVCTIVDQSIGDTKLYPGINPNYMLDDTISSILADSINHATAETKVYYYGTGCARGTVQERMRKLITNQFGVKNVYVYSDLLASARATANTSPGQVNILGTGSSSCIYDGIQIKEILPNLGYIFGDHGSGYKLGYTLLQAYFDDQLNDKIEKEIEAFSTMKKEVLLSYIYQGDTKSEIAEFAKCVHQLRHHEPIQVMISNEFEAFISRQIKLYPDYQKVDQYFTGGIASYFGAELEMCLARHNLSIEKACKNPIEELCTFHLTYNQ